MPDRTPRQRAFAHLFGPSFKLPETHDDDLRTYINVGLSWDAPLVSVNDVIASYASQEN